MYNETYYDDLSQVLNPDSSGSGVSVDRPPLIETAEITRVDKVLWVCDAKTVYTGRSCINMDIPSFGSDRIGGFGGYMPQTGDRVLVAFPSDDVFPQIIAFRSIPSMENGNRGLRKEINPGDYILCTSDMNYVHLLKGGAIDISSTPMSRRAYLPHLNYIRDWCENYSMSSAGGTIKWENRRKELSGEDASYTEHTMSVRRSPDKPLVWKEKVGKVSGHREPVSPALTFGEEVLHYSEVTSEDGKDKYLRWVDTDGNILVYSESDWELQREGRTGIFSKNGIYLGENPSTDPQSGGIRIQGGAVELAKAEESAVLGDTLLDLLNDYDAAIREFSSSVRSAATSLSSSAPTAVTAAPGSPNSMAPVLVTLASQLISASSTLESKLLSTSSKFRNFLARHVKLS